MNQSRVIRGLVGPFFAPTLPSPPVAAMRRRVSLGALAVVIALGGALATPGGGLRTAQAAHTNVVIDWNLTMLAALATAKVAAPPATRSAAIVQAAVFDAVNGIDRRYSPIHVAPAAPRGASREAAAASAAYEALVSLFPAQKPTLDADLATSMAAITDDEDGGSKSIARGLQWGMKVADLIVAWRSTDGFSSTLPDYVIGKAPGDWQPTPPSFSKTPVFRTLAVTTPFAMTSPSQFRPDGPPALTSALYTADFNEVKAFGSVDSTARNAYQTETAKFWQLDTATAIWNRVADSLATERDTSLLASARLLALINVSQADAVIAVWDAKNTFNFWRPITAIEQAATDGNPATVADANWKPLLDTPGHQEYPSGHSGVSSAAATVLASFFGERTAFTATSNGVPTAVRSFTTFSDAVAQVADARVYAGFHFRFSCEEATRMGTNIAKYVQKTLMVRSHGDGEGDGSDGNGGSSD
jgi:membrane-associated phospholipid phosphatase